MNRIDPRLADQPVGARQRRRSLGRPRLPLPTVVVLADAPALAGSAFAGSLEPPGPPAPTMKPLDVVEPRIPISSLPFTISESGSYYLTKSLSGAQGITIFATRVTLDLNGFSLTGPGAGGGTAGIRALGPFDVVVRNGFVSGWAYGVDLYGGDARIEGITAYSNAIGIALGSRGEIAGCSARGNFGQGILVQAKSVRVLRSEARENAIGIDAAGARAGFIDGCLVTGNTTGVVLSENWTLARSVISENSGSGVIVGSKCSVIDNSVSGNFGDGIYVNYGENRIESNNLVANGGWGLICPWAGNFIVRNSAISNRNGTFSIVGGNVAPIETGTVSNLASNVSY